MKKHIIPSLFFLCITIVSCSKTGLPSGSASLNVINAAPGIDNIAVNFAGVPIPFYENQNLISYGSGTEYGLSPGINPISVISAGDTTNALFSGSFTLRPGGIYSFYLAGSQAHSIDTLFMEDQIPAYMDSSAGVRFINLSAGSAPMSIDLQGDWPAQNEFTNLGYKRVSSFKKYAAGSATPGSYTFEIRDQASGNLLAVYSWTYTVFNINTIVISGPENLGGTSGVNVFQINN